MFEKLEILNTAQGLAKHAAARQSVLARNIANADTPGYRARDLVSFAETYQNAQGFETRATRQGHLAAAPTAQAEARIVQDAERAPNGNSVTLETEMTKAIEAKRHHDLALTVYRTALGVLRSSIGR